MNDNLPAFIIAELYRNSLVITGDATQKALQNQHKVTKKKPVKSEENLPSKNQKWYLGDNKKGIVILINDANSLHIKDEWLSTCIKMFEGLKISMSDIAIVNFHHHPIVYTELKTQLNAKYILLFDVNAQQIRLPFTIPNYQLQQYDDCTILMGTSVTLSAAKNDEIIKAEKRKLWECIKKLNL